MSVRNPKRVPRFVVRLAAAEMVFGLACYAIWSPEWLGRAARIYAAIALLLAVWWRWYRRRLGRERAQLDALCREPEPANARTRRASAARPSREELDRACCTTATISARGSVRLLRAISAAREARERIGDIRCAQELPACSRS